MSAAATPALSPYVPKRKVPRYKVAIPLSLTVLRSGVPDNISGRTLEIGEGGIGVAVPSRLVPGESVRVEFLLPQTSTPVRATAVVRYQCEQIFGLQFLRLPDEQQSIIRYWTRREGEILLAAGTPVAHDNLVSAEPGPTTWGSLPSFEDPPGPDWSFQKKHIVALTLGIVVIAAVLGWWRWQQGWMELEAKVPSRQSEPAKPQVKVPADVMRRRLQHEITPEYPESARLAGVQGTVVLDAVVSEDGTVGPITIVSGPETLAHSAIDAVRWWRYEPYSVNGQATAVETTVKVDFRLAN